MTTREHAPQRPNFFSRTFCGRCYAIGDLTGDCPGLPQREADNLFALVEQAIVDHFDVAVPIAKTLQEGGDWFAEIEGRRVNVSELAVTIADAMGDTE